MQFKKISELDSISSPYNDTSIIVNDNGKTGMVHINDFAKYLGIDIGGGGKLTSTTLVDGRTFNNTIDRNVTMFVRVSKELAGVPSDIVKDLSLNKDRSIITWSKDGIQYWVSNCDIIYLNPDSSQMFSNMPNLIALDLNYFNSDKLKTMYRLCYNSPKLASIDIYTWNTKLVTDMRYAFLTGDYWGGSAYCGIRWGHGFVRDSLNVERNTPISNLSTYGMFTQGYRPYPSWNLSWGVYNGYVYGLKY